MSTDNEIIIDAEHDLMPAPGGKVTVRPPNSSSPGARYLLLPGLLLLVTLLGGLRIDAADMSLRFLGPQLVCLICASILMILLVRCGVIELDGWVGGTGIQSLSGGLTLMLFFAASVQAFNSVMPESGLTMWIFGFCFVWTLVTYLLGEIAAAKVVRGLVGVFFFAFIAKYLVLANLVPSGDGNWLQRIINDPGREAASWLLDLPRFAPSTGYIQFFTIAFYFLALYITPQRLHVSGRE